MIRQYTIPQKVLTAAGTVTSNEPINGVLLGAYVPFNAGTLTLQTVSAPAQTLLTLATTGTAWYYPRANIHNSSGGTLAYAAGFAQVAPFPIGGDYIQASLNAAGTIGAITLLVKQ